MSQNSPIKKPQQDIHHKFKTIESSKYPHDTIINQSLAKRDSMLGSTKTKFHMEEHGNEGNNKQPHGFT